MCSPGEMKAFQRNIPDACSQTINVCGRSCCSEQFSSCVTCEAASAEQMLAYKLDFPCTLWHVSLLLSNTQFYSQNKNCTDNIDAGAAAATAAAVCHLLI